MADIDDLCGRVLGEFVLRERLGQGGFGNVYRADQPALGRAAVVKVLRRPAPRDDVTVQRFAREALLASQLDHPYAAHVYAFGTEDDGLVWIAMELIQGVTLSRWLAEHGCMPPEQFVPFFERLAEVVHVAHERRIVHRDLKPSNVMLIERAGQLLPKLLDFGVAALLDGVALPHLAAAEALVVLDETPRELATAVGTDGVTTARMRPSAPTGGRAGHRLTRASAAVGSPPYMAPEQWEGAEVAPAMDLYALGVLAYEALTGRRPFVAKTVAAYADLHRRAPVPALGNDLAELDATFRRALAKRPGDRFRSALEFSTVLRLDLERRMMTRITTAARQWHEHGRPPTLLWRDDVLVELERWMEHSARADTLSGVDVDFVDACLERAVNQVEAAQRLAVWRRRISIAAAIAAAAAIVGVFQFRAIYDARVARQVAAETAIQAEVEQGRAALLHDDLVEAQQHLAEAVRRGDHTPATRFMLARANAPIHAELARFSASSGRIWSAVWSADARRILTTDDRAAQIWDVNERRLVATLLHGDTVYSALFDGDRILTAGGDGSVRVWDAATGAPVQALRHARADRKATHYFAIAASAQTIAAIDTLGEIVHVWDTTGTPVAELAIGGGGWPALAFSSDGRWLATTGGRDVSVFDARTWKRAQVIPGPRTRAIAWDPGGLRLLTATTDGDASIWQIPDRRRLRHLREIGEPIDAAAWSPNGGLVVVAGREGAEQVFDAGTGRIVSQSNALHGKVLQIEFDHGSRLLAAAGAGGAVAISDALTGMPVTVLSGPGNLVRTAHFAPDSSRVLGASWDGTARIWDTAAPYKRWSSTPVAEDCGVVTSLVPDGRYVAVPCPGHPTRVWDTAGGALMAELPTIAAPDGDFAPPLPAVTTGGTSAAIARGDNVDLYALPGSVLLRSVPHAAAVSAIAFSSAGELVSGDVAGVVLRTGAGAEPVRVARGLAGIDAVALLADGRALVTAGNVIHVLAANGATVAELDAGTRMAQLRPSPDGRRLVTISTAQNVASPCLWDIERYRLIGRLDGHRGRVFAARWIAENRILSAGGDGTVRMWDSTGASIAVFRGGGRFLADATLSPHGDFVLGGGADGLLRVWDVKTARPLWTTPAHKSAVIGLRWDGEDVITRGFAGDVSRWRLSN